MARHFTEEEKDLIRKRLIEAGLELFEKYGVDKTNISDITEKVGIAKGSFYSFFNSKGDLFMEVYRIEREKVQKRMVEKFKNRKDPIDVLIKDYAGDLRKALKERPILEIVYNINGLKMISDKSVRERLLDYNKVINTQMTEMIEGWMDQQDKSVVKPHIVALMLRTLNFLKFHDIAIDPSVYDEVVDTMSEAIAQLAKSYSNS